MEINIRSSYTTTATHYSDPRHSICISFSEVCEILVNNEDDDDRD